MPSLRALLLLLLCWSVHLTGTTNADKLMWPEIPYCPSDDMNYTSGDAFQANLVTLLSSLAAASSGFAENTAGTGPDQAYGLAQCRADVNASDCLTCLNHTASEITSLCPEQRNAMLVYEGCLLRYSNASFFGAPDTGDPIYDVGDVQNKVEQPELFASQLSTLMSNLTRKAAYESPRKFAVGAINHAPLVNIYGMARCTEDTAADDCNSCLEITVSRTIPKCCSGVDGGRAFARSCAVRFDIYRFYNEEAAEAAMSPASPPAPAGSNGTDRKIILIVAVSVIASLLLPCIYVLVWLRKRGKLHFFLCGKTYNRTETSIEALIESHGSLAPKIYKYSEVMKITSSLDIKLGEGGYGVVFNGKIDDGRLVAVKFLHDSKGEGEEFVNEVMSIGRTSHVNIVSLFGFCLESSKRALIYEYMPNGSLDKYIYSENPKEILGWDELYRIAIGIARGLEYLHHGCNTRIVHFDIKPQNILLDKDFCPKIADFGLAKLCHTKESKLSMTGARGTIGFIAPEVHSRTFGGVSTKSDVYSYGMMLLEMVGGRKNVNSEAQKSSEKYFPHWIYDHFGRDDVLQSCEVSSENEGIAKKMSVIGMWCIQILPMHRPTITNVLEMFERRLDEIDMPPRQNFSRILEDPSYSLNAESTSTSSGTNTHVSSETLRMKEMSIANSESLTTITNYVKMFPSI